MTSALTFMLWNVRHGSAMYLKTPGGQHVVIDLGKGQYNEKTRRETDWSPLDHLYKKGVRRLALVVLTHPHKDHIEDIPNLHRFAVDRLVHPRHLRREDWYTNRIRREDRHLFDAYGHWTEAKLACPASVTLDGVQFRFFRTELRGKGNLNNHSVVTVVRYLGQCLVIPGDNEKASLRQLLKKPAFLQATQGCQVLVAPHHGRQSSYLPSLLQHLRPQLTLVSDGPNDPRRPTSAVVQYGLYTSGIPGISKKGEPILRRVLTTRRDGWLRVQVGVERKQAVLRVRMGRHG